MLAEESDGDDLDGLAEVFCSEAEVSALERMPTSGARPGTGAVLDGQGGMPEGGGDRSPL